jgi:hypothetical protein
MPPQDASNKEVCMDDKNLELHRICHDQLQTVTRANNNEYFEQEALEKLIEESSHINIQSSIGVSIKKENDSGLKLKSKADWDSDEIKPNFSLKDGDVSLPNIDSHQNQDKEERNKNAELNTRKSENKIILNEPFDQKENNYSKENGVLEQIQEDSNINEFESDVKSVTYSKQKNQTTLSNIAIVDERKDCNTSETINNEKFLQHKLKKLNVPNSAFKDYTSSQSLSNKSLFEMNTNTLNSENNTLYNHESVGINVKDVQYNTLNASI